MIEKQHEGLRARLVAALVATALGALLLAAAWNLSPKVPWPLALAFVVLFAGLGARRWRLALDLAILNLPLWLILPMKLGIENFSIVEAALLAAALGGAVRVTWTGRFRWFATPATPYLALFGLAVIVSAGLFFAKYWIVLDPIFLRELLGWIGAVLQIPTGHAFHPLRATLTILEGLVFFHVVVARVQETDAVRRLVRLSVISTALVCVFGVLQHFTEWNRVDFEPWAARINATFPDVNSLASWIAANLFLLLPLLRLENGRRPRGIAWLALPLIAASFFMAHSRMAYGALILALPLCALLHSERLALERPAVLLFKKRRLAATVFLLLVLLLGTIVMGFDYDGHRDLRWTRMSGAVAETLKGRLNIWRSALYNAAESPWLGRGTGTLYAFLPAHWEPSPYPAAVDWNPFWENAHNYFLQILAETGAVGLGLFLLVLGAVGWQGLRALIIHTGERPLFAGILCGLVALLLTCVTGHPLLLVEVQLWFWFAAALLFAPAESESPAFHRAQAGRRGFRRLVLGLLLVAAFGGWVEARRPNTPRVASVGMYPAEFMLPAQQAYPVHWLRQKAVFRVYQAHPDLTFCLRNLLGAAQPIEVAIRVNGRMLDRLRLDEARWRVCSYRLPETLHTAVKLEILSDREWTVPHDPRRLAIQIQSLVENTY